MGRGEIDAMLDAVAEYTRRTRDKAEGVTGCWGGSRPGSGRKPVNEPRKPYAFRLTQEEHEKVKEFIANLKSRPTGEKEEGK